MGKSKVLYRLLAEKAADVIWTADMNLRLTYMSPSVTRIRGYTVEEIMAQTMEEGLTPDSLALARKVLAEELALEKAEHVDPFRTRTVELEEICKDGSTVWMEISLTFLRDPDGHPVGILGVSRDVSKRKRAEKALRESEERYRSLFEGSPISLWEEDFSAVKAYIDDLRGSGIKDFRAYFEGHPEAVANCAAMVKVVDVSERTLDLYKAEDKWRLREGLPKVFREESYDVFAEQLVAVAEGKTSSEAEAVQQTLGGEEIYVRLNWAVAPGHERTFSKVLVSIVDITDITERKDLRALLPRVGARLTPRQKEVLEYIVAGWTNEEIAKRLVVSRRTVERHVAAVLDKFGVENRAAAAALAVAVGLARVRAS